MNIQYPLSYPLAEYSSNINLFHSALKSDLEKHSEYFIKQPMKKLKSFPIHVFPKAIQHIINRTNECLKYPNDYISAAILYATSIAIGNTHLVQVMLGWLESCVIYIVLVGRPGSNKTHPLTFALKPLQDRDDKTYDEYKRQKTEYDIANRTKRKDFSQYDLDASELPVWRKTLLSDFTPEALAGVHEQNQRGIGVYVDELAGWIKNFNRYKSSSEQEFWLTAWSNKPITIDRKGSEPILIPRPNIPVGGTIQPGVLFELAKDSRSQNGFIHRILFVMLQDAKKEYWNETQLEPEVIKEWEEIINKFLDLPLTLDEMYKPVPTVLQYTDEAKELLMDWQKKLTDLTNDADSEQLAGIYSKLEIYGIRFSLMLQLMQWACNEGNKDAVGKEAVQGAIELVNYFRQIAEDVNIIINDPNPLNSFSEDKVNLYESLPDTFLLSEGLEIASDLGVPDRTAQRFFSEEVLFKRLRRGKYQKKI
jgi:hypothetical protein